MSAIHPDLEYLINEKHKCANELAESERRIYRFESNSIKNWSWDKFFSYNKDSPTNGEADKTSKKEAYRIFSNSSITSAVVVQNMLDSSEPLTGTPQSKVQTAVSQTPLTGSGGNVSATGVKRSKNVRCSKRSSQSSTPVVSSSSKSKLTKQKKCNSGSGGRSRDSSEKIH